MKTALIELGRERRQQFNVEPTLRRLSSDQNSRYKTGSTPRLSADLPAIAPAALKSGAATGVKFLCIALAVPVLAVSLVGAEAETPPPNLSHTSENRQELSSTNQFLTAYNSMSLADLMKEKNMRAEAGELYAEALNLFLRLSADYPQWQPNVVAFRINYCRTMLQNLHGKGTVRAESRVTDKMPDPTSIEEPIRAPRLTTADSLKRTTDAGQRPAEVVSDARQPAPNNPKSEIRNPKSNTPVLSPLTARLQQAGLKERGRDYGRALAIYTQLLEEYPQEPWALKGACRCCLRMERMDKARALTRQAQALPFPDADLNLLEALVACYDGRYQSAILLLRQSLQQNGACPEAHVALGVALAATGNAKEAQEEMKRAIMLNPKLGDAYYNLARLSLRQKPTDDKSRINYPFAIDTARVHYQNALRHGAAPDPELDKLLAE